MTAPDLQAFYAELDKSIPDDCKMQINGRPWILSTMAHGTPYRPQTCEQWLKGLETKIAEALRDGN